jgi:diadenosine tetraphosphate (Ap4A) HIT family hydrolase
MPGATEQPLSSSSTIVGHSWNDSLVLLESDYWQVVRPDHFLTESHLALRLRAGNREALKVPAVAADLVKVYRIVRAGLHEVLGCDGFGVSFAWAWEPYGRGIGEPLAEWAQPTIHVFGRRPREQVKPVRVMALPAYERSAPVTVAEQAELDRRVMVALASTRPTYSVDLMADATPCDGCAPEVEHDQELWRGDGVRVIRPRNPLVDASVLVLPLRHVVSPASLRPGEIGSFVERLDEVRADLAERFGSSGLSCFLNDGARAGQETPHVHLHVFGRAVDESENPFEILAGRIGVLLR